MLAVAIYYFIWSQILGTFASVGNTLAANVGSDSATQVLVNTFFTNVVLWVPVLALIGYIYWAFTYAQKQKRMEGYY